MSDNFGEIFEEIRIGARAEYPPPQKKKIHSIVYLEIEWYTRRLSVVLVVEKNQKYIHWSSLTSE